MPVNNFEFEKADGIISSIKGQSVGRDPISAAGIFIFVSIAQKGFGYEPEEEDMIRVVHGTLEGDVFTTDLKEEEIADLLDRGCLIYFYDADNVFDVPGTKCIFFLCGTGAGANQWRFMGIDAGGDSMSWNFRTDADGYLYYYFD